MRQGIIFDFDDTLVYTNILFDQAKQAFYQRMAVLGLGDDHLSQTLNDFDIANVQAFGGMVKECFPLALGQTYKFYASKVGLKASPAEVENVENMGWQVFSRPLITLPGAVNLLKALQGNYRLFLLTQGDPVLQQERLAQSGLASFFTDCRVCKIKTAQSFGEVALINGLRPGDCWSIGNSLRSDIKPALTAGLRAIHLKTDGWDYEKQTPQGFFYAAKSLKDCGKYLRLF